ncbi:MAG: Inner membrane amino-acid ABC transporter permease protein YecS [Firmicutes bacterium ADurb.Bin193]|nr:MAG: Inner membrane amino-acid ABC transporter permease protein YecS [Firmicutes bacterium ADurb.Bin193]
MDFAYILKMLPLLLGGSVVTVKIFALTLLLSIPLGLITAIGNLTRFKALKSVIRFYILIMRGTPLMLQVMFVYYGLPMLLNVKLDNFPSAIIAFVLNYAAYFAEIFRGGIESIPNGQREAALALGFSRFKTMFFIIIPQAVRAVLPALSNETITLVKDTALVSVISLEELLRSTRLIVQRDLTVVPFLVAAMFYLVATVFLTWLFARLEEHFAFSN